MVIAALMVSGALVYVVIGNLNDGDTGNNEDPAVDDRVTVYYMLDGEKVEKKAQGSSLRELFDNAIENVVFNSAGQVSSVDGVMAGEDQKWVMWTWSKAKWSPLSSVNDAIVLNGRTHIALMLSDVEIKDGKTSYTAPDFSIAQKVWFFIKFDEDYNANSHVTSYLTAEERQAGFWVCGEGIDAAYAFQDVAERLGWELDMDMENTPNGWLWSFFGLADVGVGKDWRYWSQYHWNGDKWVYSQSVMGGFDISKVCYFALVRQTTSVNSVGFEWDVTPEDIPPSLLA